MFRAGLLSLSLCVLLAPRVASATSSAELYTTTAYGYGRFEARLRFAPGDGVVSSFFLWKDGSQQPGVFWNELDFEKVGADCHLSTTAFYGNPGAAHALTPTVTGDLCGAYHVYAYEWTPDALVWLVDGTEIRRETGATAQAYADNAASTGMQIHFNVWPGDATFGGNFSTSILPVFEYIDWVQFSAYANGAFTLSWREDFSGTSVPTNWGTGNWASDKNLSTHDPRNVNFVNGYAVLSLTADDATGATGADPGPAEATGGAGAGAAGAGGGNAAGASAGGTSGGGTNAGGTSAGGTNAAGGSAGGTSAGGTSAGGTSAGGTNGGATSTGGTSTGGTSAGGTSAGGTSATSAGGTSATSTGGTSAGGTSTTGGAPAGMSVGGTGTGGTSASAGSGTGGADSGAAHGGSSQQSGGCSVRGAGDRQSSFSILAALALALLMRRNENGARRSRFRLPRV